MDASPEAFKEYLYTVKARGTAEKYAYWADHFIKTLHVNGYENLEEMPSGVLSMYTSLLSRDGKSPATVQNASYGVKKYLKWLKDSGVGIPEITQPDLPTVRHAVKASLSPDNLFEYLRTCDTLLDEPLRTAAMLLPCTGLRGEEMAKLRLEDIQRVSIRLKDGSSKSVLALTPWGKGNKQRVVPIFDEGAEILIGYLTGWRRGKRGTYVYPNVHDKKRKNMPISGRYVRAAVQKTRESMGMHFTAHTMRRTYLTMLWRKGVDVATIAKIAGHSNVQTLITHYLSINTEDIASAFHARGSALTQE